tara:strand:+ start:2901 stop:3623 length:723 start_codon:yes stop_codon:yes gene_type:complete
VFQAAIIVMVLSGFMRARAPLQTTDMPFLITAGALLIVSILPPPAIALSGPLCEPASLFGAAERFVRAMSFGVVFVVFVYTSSPHNVSSKDVYVCLMRSSAASLWTLGAAMPLLVLALPQCGIAIYSRLHYTNPDNNAFISNGSDMYSHVDTTSPGETDEELSEAQESFDLRIRNEKITIHNNTPDDYCFNECNSIAQLGATVGKLSFRDICIPKNSACMPTSNGVSKERMAQIAAKINT